MHNCSFTFRSTFRAFSWRFFPRRQQVHLSMGARPMYRGSAADPGSTPGPGPFAACHSPSLTLFPVTLFSYPVNKAKNKQTNKQTKKNQVHLSQERNHNISPSIGKKEKNRNLSIVAAMFQEQTSEYISVFLIYIFEYISFFWGGGYLTVYYSIIASKKRW